MNYRVKWLLVFAFLAVTAGWAFWSIRPEYGAGYSEQQRKLWNERRALYPAAWRLGSMTLDPDSASYLHQFTSMDEAEMKALLQEREKRDDALKKRQHVLRDREKLSYQLGLALPQTESLRIEEVSVRECLERARKGDAEACLIMAWKMGWGLYWGSDLLMSWNRTKDADYWLGRAEALGYPGAKFLKNFSSMAQTDARKAISHRSMSGYSWSTISCPDYTSLPGYEDFLKSVRSGNVLVYRMMRDMKSCYSFPGREKDILWGILRERAQSGDVRAMEDLSAVAFCEDQMGEYNRDIREEMETSLWNRMIELLPKKIREDCRRACFRTGLLDVENTAAMRNFREAVEYARQGARQGNMACMAYWLEFGLLGLDYFSQEDWEDVFRYRRLLFEHGYSPYICQMGCLFGGSQRFDAEIASCYYRQDDLQSKIGQFQKFLCERGIGCDLTSLLAESSVDCIESQWDDAVSVYGADRVLSMLMMKMEKMTPEMVGVCLTQVKKQVERGDPYAAFVQGYLLEQGRLQHVDLGEAWKSYEKAWERVDPKDLTSVYLNFSESFFQSIKLPEAIKMSMLSMLVHHAEFPGRDLSKVPVLLGELEEFAEDDRSGQISYIIGRVYEDGIGAPVNREKALKYYKQGKRGNSSCAKRWEKLQESAPAGQR